MQKEGQNDNWQLRIEKHLSHIKVLLIILIDLCILGFYGLSRAMWDDIAGTMTTIAEYFLVAGLLGTVLIPIIWRTSLSQTN